MTLLRRLPARFRLTLAFAATTAGLLTIFAVLAHATIAAALFDELDTGLRARAATVQADLSDPGLRLSTPPRALLEPTEQFVQILSVDGVTLGSTPGIRGPVLPAGSVRAITGPRWFQRTVPGVVGTARILAMPARHDQHPVVLITGASMSDRADALAHVTTLLLAGIPATLLVASILGWLLAGASLRQIERMRAEASAITLSGLDHRLSVPPATDEFRRLALTLNDMLGRLETATISERRFLDDASHQLRTPLAVLCAELELAARRPRSHEELLAAVQDAYDEATRLAAMADQLLTNARRTGRLAIARQPTHLSLLLRDAALTFSNRAARIGIRITVDTSDAVVYLDARRVRQALDNLIDNALRHGRTATAIHLRGRVDADWVCIVIEDDGVGFSARPLDEDGTDDRHGLGLPYVTATVAAHGGTIAIDNNPAGGARLTMRLPTLPQDADSDLAAHPGPAGGKVASS